MIEGSEMVVKYNQIMSGFMGRTRCVAWIVFMSISTSIFFTIHCLPVETLHDTAALDPDIYRNVTELITSKNYHCEEHSVITDDGFVLGLQRIPYGKSTPLNRRGDVRPVVFLQHGLLDSSATWVMNSAQQSLGFILADAGFDVWLGNLRGNTYSRQHIKYLPEDKEFWAWSWDEMARYDLPAMVDYVLKTTSQSDLFYIGHSQGTMIAFAKLSEDQLFAKKIKAFFALGPVATVGHIKGALSLLADVELEIKVLIELLGIKEFLPNRELMKFLATHVCNNFASQYICEDIVFLISGYDKMQLNASRIPVYIAHTPAGTSVQNIIHFSQLVNSKKFQMYDYGSAKLNMLHYKQTSPPLYNVSTVNVPTYLYSAQNDYLSDPEDVKMLVADLHCLKETTEIANWEHLDFVWGLNANKILYTKLIDIMHSL